MTVNANIKPLAWESDFFGLTSGLVVWDDAAAELTPELCARWPRLQAKVNTAACARLDALQQLGFRLVESEVDFCIPLSGAPQGAVARQAGIDDIAVLRLQAESMFSASRFRAPWYPAEDAGRFYAQWVENAVRGSFDNLCLVTADGADVAGFVTLRQLSEGEARIGLLGGRGQGAALMAVARDWCLNHGIHKLYVATQLSNHAAMRRYILSGGTVCDTAYWLYR